MRPPLRDTDPLPTPGVLQHARRRTPPAADNFARRNDWLRRAQPFPTEACCRAGQGLTQMRVALSGCVREPGTRALARRRLCAAHLQRLLPRDGPVASGVPPRARPCAKRAHRAPRPTLLFLPMRPFGGAKRGCRRNAAVLCVLQVPPCWTLLALPETAFGVLKGAALSVLQGCGSVHSCRFSIIADRQCHRSQALTLDHALRTAPSVSMKDTTLSERSDARRSPHCPHVPAKPTAGCPMCRQWKAGVVEAEHNERVEAIADTLTRVHIEKKLRCAIKRQAHMRHRRRVVRGRPQRPIPRACWWRIASVEAPRVALAQRWRERRAGGTRCQRARRSAPAAASSARTARPSPAVRERWRARRPMMPPRALGRGRCRRSRARRAQTGARCGFGA